MAFEQSLKYVQTEGDTNLSRTQKPLKFKMTLNHSVCNTYHIRKDDQLDWQPSKCICNDNMQFF